MGLLSNISSAARNLVGAKASNTIADLANKALTVITKPVQSITNFKAAESKTASQGALSLVAQGVSNTLGVLTLGKLATTGAAKTAASSAAKFAVANPIQATKNVAAGAALTAGAVVASSALISSSKAREAVVSAPSSLVNVGTNIGKVIQDPSISTAKELITDNPLLVAVGAAAAVGGVGLGLATVAPTVSSYLNTQAIKENTKASSNPLVVDVPTPTGYKVMDYSTLPNNSISPVTPTTPQTKQITKTSGKKRKSKPKTTTIMNQKVNLIVSSRSSSTGIKQTKKYLNARVLA